MDLIYKLFIYCGQLIKYEIISFYDFEKTFTKYFFDKLIKEGLCLNDYVYESVYKYNPEGITNIFLIYNNPANTNNEYLYFNNLLKNYLRIQKLNQLYE
jgi:hypothetical protein